MTHEQRDTIMMFAAIGVIFIVFALVVMVLT